MTSSPHNPLPVLVVDDDAQMLRTITDILRAHGYAPTGVPSGLEALRVAKGLKVPAAIALIDLALPDIDGIELVGRLRQISDLTEVVILTGNASLDSAVRAMREESYDYLIKPVQPEHLLATLERASERSQRRSAEAAGRESEERLRRIFNHVSDALFIATDAGAILDANPAACALTGLSVEDLRKLPLLEVLPESVSATRWSEGAGEAPTAAGVQRRETIPARTRVLDIDAVAFTPGVLVYTVRDFTNQSQLEEQLAQSQKMEAIGQLAGGIAHDFNNLLTVIMSYSSLLLADFEAGDPRRGDLEEISNAASRASGLTKQLLAFSRKQLLEPRVISVNTVVMGIEKLLRRLIGDDIELMTTLSPDVALINADPGQLEQVMINLAVNARDAMPEGGHLHITTANTVLSKEHTDRHLEAAPGKYVELAVTDTGTGMTKEVQQRVFEPFFTTKGQGKGTGLGLSTVYGIVKQSGGDVWVYSEPEHGTTFKVYFPQVSEDVVTAEAGPQEKENAPRGDETVLIVEDDAALRTLAARVLEGSGYTVLLARNGIEALAIASGHDGSIDMVATDVVMPKMNGRPLVEKLLETRTDMRVLFMSGYTDDEVMRRGVIDGSTAFLQKPFTPAQFARKVRDVLDQKPAARTVKRR
jgi:two-component system, cell cycle sensor histidine kinase and response regulator CckA